MGMVKIGLLPNKRETVGLKPEKKKDSRPSAKADGNTKR
jgi:hypothetical protein